LEVAEDSCKLQQESAYLGIIKELLSHCVFSLLAGLLPRLCARVWLGRLVATVVAVVGLRL
jgi:hypothetical protein